MAKEKGKHFHPTIYGILILFLIWLWIVSYSVSQLHQSQTAAPQAATAAITDGTIVFSGNFGDFLIGNGYYWKCINSTNTTKEEFVDDSYDKYCSYDMCIKSCYQLDTLCSPSRYCYEQHASCYDKCLNVPPDEQYQKQQAVKYGCYKPAHFENVTTTRCEESQLMKHG